MQWRLGTTSELKVLLIISDLLFYRLAIHPGVGEHCIVRKTAGGLQRPLRWEAHWNFPRSAGGEFVSVSYTTDSAITVLRHGSSPILIVTLSGLFVLFR